MNLDQLFELKYDQLYDKGFQIIPDVLNENEVSDYKQRIVDVYKKQVNDFGIEKIRLIKEENVARSPFLYDSEFQNLFYNDLSIKIVSEILGDHAILSLQNAIFIPGGQSHHQSFYHRDIIYQEFTSSKPLAINLYYCLDDYNEETGGTSFIPTSHRKEKATNFKNEEIPNVKAGSIILFDSMVFHKAGTNRISKSRFGINNMFSLPFIKQQINYPYLLGKRRGDAILDRLLGFDSREFLSVIDFRESRLKRSLNDK
jgi:ectoine hydroxylase-related dioxygenase (phytanoyl-CoA dioxygenase family)